MRDLGRRQYMSQFSRKGPKRSHLRRRLNRLDGRLL